MVRIARRTLRSVGAVVWTSLFDAQALAAASAPLDVALPAFAIATAPVRVREFSRYADAANRSFHWGRGGGDAPAMVGFDDALGYAVWRGARLPTAAEAERATREIERQLFIPGGDPEREWTADGATCAGVEGLTRCPAVRPRHGADATAAIRLVRVDPAATPVADPLGDALFEAIAGDPAAVSIYADHLQERGDPRGEYIALQLRGENPERQRQLWLEHAVAWLGPLYPVLDPRTRRVERGFVVACRVVGRAPIGDRRWSTVEELDCADPALIEHPCMRALRRLAAPPQVLAQLTDTRLEALVGHRVWSRGRLTARGIELDGDPDSWARIGDGAAFPHVRSLAITTVYHPGDHVVNKLLASPLGRRLTEIHLTIDRDYDLATWLPALDAPGSLGRVSMSTDSGWAGDVPNDLTIVLERGPELRCELARPTADGVCPLAISALSRLAQAGLRRVVIETSPGGSSEQLRRIAPGFAELVVRARA